MGDCHLRVLKDEVARGYKTFAGELSGNDALKEQTNLFAKLAERPLIGAGHVSLDDRQHLVGGKRKLSGV